MSGFLVPGAMGPVAMAAAASAAGNWWEVAGQTCVAAYKAIGAADLATSYVNLANPGTNNAAPGVAPGVAPGLAAGGWTFAAANSQYLTTGIVPTTGYSMVVRVSNVSGDSAIAGVIIDPYTLWFAIRRTTAPIWRFYASTVYDFASALTAGVFAIAGTKAYVDGSEVGTMPGMSGTAADDIHIGRYYGAETRYLSGTIAAVAIYSTTLSASDVAALATRMAALA